MPHLSYLISRYQTQSALDQASTPPSAWYTDERVADLEKQAVFVNTWQPVARLDQLQNKGDCVTVTLADEPLLIINSGEIKAFYNVCRHHGAQVVTEDSEQLIRLHCPYHGWTYSLDGKLLSTPNFDGACNFDREDHGLISVRTEIWGPWVFVNLNADTESLTTTLGDLTHRIDAGAQSQLQFYTRKVYDLDCNWKVFVDNYLDGGYHVPFIHKGLSSVLDNQAYQVEVRDKHCIQSCPVTSGDTDVASVREGDMAHYYWQYPNFMINCYEGVMDTHWVLPLDTQRCRVICDFFFSKIITDQYKDESVSVADSIQQEDMDICASVQRGLNSRAYDTGRLSPQKEAGEYLFHQLLYKDLKAALSSKQTL